MNHMLRTIKVFVMLLANAVPYKYSTADDPASALHRVNWSNIHFSRDQAPDLVTVTLGRPGEAGFNLDLIDVEFSVSSSEKNCMEDFAIGFRKAVRLVDDVPNGYSGAAFSGVIELRRGDKKIPIYLFDSAFVLGDPVASNVNLFYSWSLAKAVDDLLRKGGHKGLSAHQFEGISGLRRLKQDQEAYLLRRDSQR